MWQDFFAWQPEWSGRRQKEDIFHSQDKGMRKLRSWWKRLGKSLIARVNLEVKRGLNGRSVILPVVEGRKAGIGGEHWMSGLLKRLLESEKGGFYDVGVNLGQTLAKVKSLEPGRAYVGFEPSPFCQHYVSRLVACNQWPNVTICPCALFDRDTLLPMTGAASGNAAATLIAELRSHHRTATTLVPAFRFDAVAEAMPPGRVAIVKIDVEGAEVEVVRSLSGLLIRDMPVITLEVLPLKGAETTFRASRNAELKSMLEGLGYVHHVIKKTDDDHFAGVEADPDFGTHSDARFKDYLAIPRHKLPALLESLLA
jgi:FkbM family methyltransferase